MTGSPSSKPSGRAVPQPTIDDMKGVRPTGEAAPGTPIFEEGGDPTLIQRRADQMDYVKERQAREKAVIDSLEVRRKMAQDHYLAGIPFQIDDMDIKGRT